MRVKLGDRWHEVGPGHPIAVELTLKDRDNIAKMLPEATRYGVFPDGMTSDEMRQWLGDALDATPLDLTKVGKYWGEGPILELIVSRLASFPPAYTVMLTVEQLREALLQNRGSSRRPLGQRN